MAGAAYFAERVREQNRLTREVKEAALQLGQGAEDTSRLLGAGFDPMMLSKFQRSLADQSPEQLTAFKKLGLNPDELGTKPLLESLESVAEAFDGKVGNAADRASIAMHLFRQVGCQGDRDPGRDADEDEPDGRPRDRLGQGHPRA